MKCPCCPNSMLVMADPQGVEIDYCPTCRGIWLVLCESDEIIERASVGAVASTARATPAPPANPYPHQARHLDFEDSDYGKKGYPQRSYKKSWLSEIFD